MGRKRKGRDNDSTLQKLLVITAILNLIKSLIDLIRDLSG